MNILTNPTKSLRARMIEDMKARCHIVADDLKVSQLDMKTTEISAV